MEVLLISFHIYIYVYFFIFVLGDNGRLTYELPEGVADNHFEIDSQSGVITTQVKLDREERDYYSFTG